MSDMLTVEEVNVVLPDEDDEEVEVTGGDKYATVRNDQLIGMLISSDVSNEEAGIVLGVVQNRIKAELKVGRKTLADAKNAYEGKAAIVAAQEAFDKAAKALPEYASLKALLETRENVFADLESKVSENSNLRTLLDTMLPTVRKIRGDETFGTFIRARKGEGENA